MRNSGIEFVVVTWDDALLSAVPDSFTFTGPYLDQIEEHLKNIEQITSQAQLAAAQEQVGIAEAQSAIARTKRQCPHDHRRLLQPAKLLAIGGLYVGRPAEGLCLDCGSKLSRCCPKCASGKLRSTPRAEWPHPTEDSDADFSDAYHTVAETRCSDCGFVWASHSVRERSGF